MKYKDNPLFWKESSIKYSFPLPIRQLLGGLAIPKHVWESWLCETNGLEINF